MSKASVIGFVRGWVQYIVLSALITGVICLADGQLTVGCVSVIVGVALWIVDIVLMVKGEE